MATTKKPKEVKTKTEVTEEVEKQKNSRNLLIVACIALALILLGVYIYKWKEVKNEEKLSKSYLLDTGTVSLEIKNLDEVEQILSESPTEYFVLISYTGNEDTYKLESGLKNIIDEYKLSDSFYYLNVENLIEEDNYLTRINDAFNTDVIKKVPIILYYKDGKIVDITSRADDNCINAGDFQKLLDTNDYKGQ